MPVLWDIINMSDPYTMACDDFETASLAILFLGNGRYGADEIDGQRKIPLLFLGGLDEWFTETFGRDTEASIKKVGYTAIADALETVVIGDQADRKLFEHTMSELPDDNARKRYAEHWHDAKRTSMNDIGRRAKALVDAFRAKAAVPADA